MLKNIRLERPLVILDLETTGKKVQTDRIVDISLLKLLPDGTNQIKTHRLNPGIPIPAEATAIHGITDADVANEYSFRQVARSLVAYLGFKLRNLFSGPDTQRNVLHDRA